MTIPPLLAGPPRFGVAAVIVNAEGKLLVGQRFGSHGAGSWQLPGGHLEEGEGLLHCAVREAKEEAGLDVLGRCIVATTYNVFEQEGKHYVTWFALCKLEDPKAVPKAMEPRKCPEWSWKSREELLHLNLFLPLETFLRRRVELDENAKDAGLVIKLPSPEQEHSTVSIRWDPACEDGCKMIDGAVVLTPGQDFAIADASPKNALCRLCVMVTGKSEGQGRPVAWPLGNDISVLPLKNSSDGSHQAMSLMDLCGTSRRT
ncbi:hypothetical protein HIM_06838 [Hirsutella minnesotensis 3608]|uniref:Nudix hydrolase domain-containing protein n=1 Tax=Hirsutella minnesotensis 3608 TaxID=1043627 RepID=A0A0F7ZNG7_9HYPO|nr:hypothetical protein HIM_06838 [Hirsutella minnesotensis 3608]